jgi:O-antigen/teichoic acid export membrane protein
MGSSIAVLGMDKTVTRFLPVYQEKGEHPKLFGTIILMVATVLSISFFFVILIFGLQGWIADSFIRDQQTVTLLLLLIFMVPIQAFDSLLVGMLAIFAKPSTIFFRRHVLGPGLKLLVVLLLVLFGGGVYFLSIGYVIAGALGILIYSIILIRDLRNQDLWKHFNGQSVRFPIKEIFSFSAPLLTTNFVYVMRSQVVILLLEYFHNPSSVADFRAVQPVADLNTVVIHSFGLLFLPTIARLHTKNDQAGIKDLYWQSVVWISIITFPIFLLTFSLAEPLTLLLFGERYAESAVIMALLAFGYYFNAALGYNADTLRVYGRLRYTMVVDVLAMLISLGLCLILIPRYGAVGAALGTCGTLVLYNTLNHLGLKSATKINLFSLSHLRVYASIALGALVLLAFQELVSAHLIIDLLFAGVISLVVLILNRKYLRIEQTFPELLRFKLIRLLFQPNSIKAGKRDEP